MISPSSSYDLGAHVSHGLNAGNLYSGRSLRLPAGGSQIPFRIINTPFDLLGHGFTYGSKSAINALDISGMDTRRVESAGELKVFKKIATLEDYEEIETAAFNLTGYSTTPFFGGSVTMDMGVSTITWVAAVSKLSSTTEITGGLENMMLTDLAKGMFTSDPELFLSLYGFDAYESVTHGFTAHASVSLRGGSFEEGKLLRQAFKDVDESVFWDKEMSDKFDKILQGLPFSPSYRCDYGSLGGSLPPGKAPCTGLRFLHEYGEAFEQWEETLLDDPSMHPIVGVTSKISDSADVRKEIEKLPVEVVESFEEDDVVVFRLSPEAALALTKDYIRADYVEDMANSWGGLDDTSQACSDIMQNIANEATSYNLLQFYYNATDLRIISDQIKTGEFVGRGQEILDRYNQALENECARAPAPTEGPTPAAPAETSAAARYKGNVFVILSAIATMLAPFFQI